MTILVFGRTGQVATELQLQADVVALGRDQADLSDPDACAAEITAHKPSLVINAAAYTAVDRAESEEALATSINGTAPAAMASAAAALGVPFLHISTDYVFDGSGTRAWAPDDATGPLGAYGRSKLVGEQGVAAAGGAHVILRTSWVFSPHGANFVKTMMRLGAERNELNVVNDQYGGPTAASDIAAALLKIAAAFAVGKGHSGIYHFAGQPTVSWADFAREIFAGAGLPVEVNGIPTSAYPTPAKRPGNSRMDGASLMRDYGIQQPDWRVALQEMLAASA